MQHLFLTLAVAASYVSAQTTTEIPASPSQSPTGAVVAIGEKCTPGGTPCALGADCYSTNSGLHTICGNFQASCTSDQQCAFNVCNLEEGFCNGALLSSASSSATAPPATSSAAACPAPGSTDSQGRYSCNPAHQYPSGQECIVVDGCYFLSSTVSSVTTSSTTSSTTSLPTAPAGTLPLGAQCDPYVTPSQCAGDVQCWASNSMLIAACGNFNAACKKDSQCAFHTCNNGLCNGFKPSGSYNGTSTAQPTGGYNSTNAPTGTNSPSSFTGAATLSRTSEMGGLMAALLAAAAWII
ncbi:hypothetical protein P171DRAFT_437223 [Karstenula rhodostoma CBS 690.94]|uniref:Uncharacterized protein n=1 Tax=Karstenula rhodostoma CBS 690.94 TaxID=1392251 RepID=A0A9P4U4P0_9PLEO|nr:hypothetical protein P171DRAFT_437223 [Karstenula rhodostoma CBS 690.94]